MHKLTQLHPQADPPDVDVSDTTPVQITAAILVKALQLLPQGSSGGASAWTYEHIKAAYVCHGMFEATLLFMNNIVSGNLPDILELRACRLAPLKTKGTVDGVCPIAVGEVRLRLAALCAMEACPTKRQSLLPLQCGVGWQEVHNVWYMQ